MKRFTLTFCAATLLLLACNSDKKETTTDTNSMTGDTATKKEEAWVPVDSATQMKAWMDYATPGDPHKALAKSNGNWTATVTHWMGKGAPAQTSVASASNKMVMGGLYQMSDFKGDMMGMPFTGMSITGFDNYKKKYVSAWIDNMGSGIMHMEGPWDEASKSMTLTGSMIDPATGKECKMREVFKIVDDNNQVMEMYGPDPKTGEEYQTMEIKFTRK